MATEKSRFKLFVYGTLIVLLLFGLIRILISTGGKFLQGELIVFIVLLLLTVVGFCGYVRVFGERVLFFVFLFYLTNLVLVWYLTGAIYMVLLFLTLIGFLMSLPNMRGKSFVSSVPEKNLDSFNDNPHNQIFDVDIEEADPKDLTNVVETEPKVVKKAIKKIAKTKHSPGKYVASKNSNIYHEPKCEWAKKIKPNRRNWFKSKEDAWEEGYKSHACVK